MSLKVNFWGMIKRFPPNHYYYYCVQTNRSHSYRALGWVQVKMERQFINPNNYPTALLLIFLLLKMDCLSVNKSLGLNSTFKDLCVDIFRQNLQDWKASYSYNVVSKKVVFYIVVLHPKWIKWAFLSLWRISTVLGKTYCWRLKSRYLARSSCRYSTLKTER